MLTCVELPWQGEFPLLLREIHLEKGTREAKKGQVSGLECEILPPCTVKT